MSKKHILLCISLLYSVTIFLSCAPQTDDTGTENTCISSLTQAENKIRELEADKAMLVESVNEINKKHKEEIEGITKKYDSAKRSNRKLSEQLEETNKENLSLNEQNELLNVFINELNASLSDCNKIADTVEENMEAYEDCANKYNSLLENYYVVQKEIVDDIYSSYQNQRDTLELAGAYKPTIPEYERISTALELIDRLYAIQIDM